LIKNVKPLKLALFRRFVKFRQRAYGAGFAALAQFASVAPQLALFRENLKRLERTRARPA
jgi:hypothetical protein